MVKLCSRSGLGQGRWEEQAGLFICVVMPAGWVLRIYAIRRRRVSPDY